jgi:hypothetical protein
MYFEAREILDPDLRKSSVAPTSEIVGMVVFWYEILFFNFILAPIVHLLLKKRSTLIANNCEIPFKNMMKIPKTKLNNVLNQDESVVGPLRKEMIKRFSRDHPQHDQVLLSSLPLRSSLLS